MMRVGLSFLGLNRYQTTRYYWETEEQNILEYDTDLFPEVLPTFFSLSKLLVFVTKEVEEHENCQRLKDKLGELMETVRIPLGKTEEELWNIFSIVTAKVPPCATIIIDITHAFRSLPLIVFNVASYLRRIKKVKVERIIYGNFEARDKNLVPSRTPIFDLTSTLDLQDWLHGIDAFQRRGDAEELADSLSKTQGRLYQTSHSENAILPRKLKHTAKQLRNFSKALRFLRPLETTPSAVEICNLLKTVQNEALRWAKPFADVLQDINAEISPLQNRAPDILNIENLEAQLKLIEYYLNKDLVVQAVLLAREWLVSCLMFLTNRHVEWREKEARLVVECELGQAASKQRESEYTGELPHWYRQIPQSSNINDAWNKLSSLRNNVAHCAMNTDAASPGTIRNNIKALIPSLEALLDF